MRLKPTDTNAIFTANVDRVQEKKNADGFSDEFDRQKKDDQNDDSQKNQKKIEVTEKDVHDAIETFGDQKLAKDLEATTDGVGPGLKVILKDKNGKLIRQMTGAEFVDLKQSLEKQGSAVGKMLDQKL